MSDLVRQEIVIGADIIETLTAALYDDPLIVFREYVQNSLDSFNRGDIQSETRMVNITIDFQVKKICISDNGPGIEEDEFEEKMNSFGHSAKQGVKNQIGYKGIGRLSGLSFCKKLIFTNRATGQVFSIDGEKYREQLKLSVKNGILQDVFRDLSSISAITTDGSSRGFQVEMQDVNEELMRLIVGRRFKDQSDPLKPSEEFVCALRKMLPLPYASDFSKGTEIRSAFYDSVKKNLSLYECHVRLNGDELTKYVPDDIDKKLFILLPVDLPCADGETIVHAGVMWLAFNHVLKSAGPNFGICVRSQNVLLQDGAVFASEASLSDDADTTFGQFLSASKCVVGEMLLDTEKLVENSRRDWFKTDACSLGLRNYIAAVMNSIHQYRYAVSRYVNSPNRDQDLAGKVLDAFDAICKCGKRTSVHSKRELDDYLNSVNESRSSCPIDVKSDPSDLRGYPKSKRLFYKQVMDIVYEFYCEGDGVQKNDVADYYALKSFIVKRLNEMMGEDVNA